MMWRPRPCSLGTAGLAPAKGRSSALGMIRRLVTQKRIRGHAQPRFNGEARNGAPVTAMLIYYNKLPIDRAGSTPAMSAGLW